MSMRLFSRGEFVKELKKFGFIETQQKTANAFIVSYKGQPFVVPLMESYPDYMVDDLLSHACGDQNIEETHCAGGLFYSIKSR